MPVYKAVRNKSRCPSHPGAVINDILQDIDKTKSEIASMLGISRQQLYDILTEKKPVSAQASVRIAKLFGGSPESWLRMQASHDAWHAGRSVASAKSRRFKRRDFRQKQRPPIDPMPSRSEHHRQTHHRLALDGSVFTRGRREALEDEPPGWLIGRHQPR
jgi:addiction module HigA family antidote